jgi:uncharacterized protein (TIGR02271 family)
MLDKEQILNSTGGTVLDKSGAKIGSVQDIYLDDRSGEPEWVLVSTGWVGNKGTFVPLQNASQQGNDIVVPYDEDFVKGAPTMDPDGQLTPQEENQLYEYYGLAGLGAQADVTDRDTTAGTGRGTDDAMTRSEEELHVGTEQRERGRARLRKYVVTEEVTKTVPVQREEVRLEREPITDENVDEAVSGPEITDSEHEVVLREEEPVVEKRTVPKERVRLEKDKVTDEARVSEEVRKEQIDTEGEIRPEGDVRR